MQSSPTSPNHPLESGAAERGLLLAAAAVLLVAILGSSAWLRAALTDHDDRAADLQRQLEDVRETVRLMRLEAGVDATGVEALFEQIETWAPDLARASTPAPAIIRYEAHLAEVVDAAAHLGPEIFEPLAEKLESDATDLDLEIRKWLLRCLMAADPQRGQDYLAQVLRGTRLRSKSSLRFFAADQLLAHDKQFAGAVLAQILQIESAAGITRPLPPSIAKEYERIIGTNQFPDFFNLIDRFVASGHEDVVPVLIMLLGRAEHDRMTYQRCIQHLGELGAQESVPHIKRLFVSVPKREFNPLFQNTCLQAISQIQGSEACAWFQETLKTVQNELVATRLRELIKQNC